MRRVPLLLALCLAASVANAQSLNEYSLSQLLERVARESSVGTPRAINADLLDRGYSVDGETLVNHIDVQPRHAAKMRDNPGSVREQLTISVCSNPGFRELLKRGATLRYDFREYQSERPVASQRFAAADCTPS